MNGGFAGEERARALGFGLKQTRTCVQCRRNWHRRKEPKLVGAVVHTVRHTLEVNRELDDRGHQAEREETMRNRAAERAGIRPLYIDMNPLVVPSQLSEEVDFSWVISNVWPQSLNSSLIEALMASMSSNRMPEKLVHVR